ncbi:uncharacterized protein K02A2.6-like [Saccostrea cucullata]|uniref:uncharacterized protein K02A2.6-like n=1 Tax=Saccostrea cuccullata TaxID=36930 RepID=UPI002ED0D774
MKQRLRSKVWWPKMDQGFEQWNKACYGCQLVSQPEKVVPIHRTELPSRPWEHLAADFLGPLPSEDCFTIVDYYSRWIDLAVMRSTTAEKMVEGKTTPLWPQASGEIERQNRSILKRLKIAQAENKDWKSELQTYLLMYRSSPHTTTGVSPAELLFRRVIRTKLPDIHTYRQTDYRDGDRDAEKKAKGKIYSESKRGATLNDIKPGDLALMNKNKENKLSATYHSNPFKVVEKKWKYCCVKIHGGSSLQKKRIEFEKVCEFQGICESVK